MHYALSASELIERSKVTDPPVNTPIDTDDLKAQIRRVGFTVDDALLDLYIKAGTEQAQNYMGRKLITQELTLTLDRWPFASLNDVWWSGIRNGAEAQFRNRKNDFIELPWPPAISITSISTFNDVNVETVYPATNYFLDNADNDIYARVIFNFNAQFPSNLRDRNAIKIVFKVGYGLAKDEVPADMRVGISMISAYLYGNRGDCNDCSCVAASGGKSFLDLNVIHTIR